MSFGSSKGSMVETLVFETPTPLPEDAEREFGFPDATSKLSPLVLISTEAGGAGLATTAPLNVNTNSCHDDSGIEMPEE